MWRTEKGWANHILHGHAPSWYLKFPSLTVLFCHHPNQAQPFSKGTWKNEKKTDLKDASLTLLMEARALRLSKPEYCMHHWEGSDDAKCIPWDAFGQSLSSSLGKRPFHAEGPQRKRALFFVLLLANE